VAGLRPSSLYRAQAAAVLDHSRALAQADGSERPAFAGSTVGCHCYLEVIYPCDVLDDAVACGIQDVYAEGKVRLGFHGQVDSTRAGPLVFYPMFAPRLLPRLLRTVPAQPSREAARWGRVAARDQTRRFPNAGPPRWGGVRLFTRNGHDWPGRFPLIARAALSLKAVSCLIDGEAVACDDNGVPVFDRLRYRRDDGCVFLYAFDLIELDGNDLRHEPIERRKVLLIRLLAKASGGLQVNDHIVEPGDVVFRHACQLGLEGIVSKRLGSPYSSGRSRHWVKSKNREHPAVRREEEEDWGR
jgi:bifunctional non-homologous end joining protein LigD